MPEAFTLEVLKFSIQFPRKTKRKSNSIWHAEGERREAGERDEVGGEDEDGGGGDEGGGGGNEGERMAG